MTSRVAVNHFWQTLFGAGLVRTTEDFGSQGESSSHPELLDWMAVVDEAQRPEAQALLETSAAPGGLIRTFGDYERSGL